MRIYCDFGCRRPEEVKHGLFSVAFYAEKDAQRPIYKRVIRAELWANDPYISNIQCYMYALDTIFQAQGYMYNAGVKQVLLRHDSAVLVNWIANPRLKKKYIPYFERANRPYRIGSFKEIVQVSVGICERVEYNKARKYCKEENVTDDMIEEIKSINDSKKKHIIETGTRSIDGKISNSRRTIYDMIEDSLEVPEIDGMKEVTGTSM